MALSRRARAQLETPSKKTKTEPELETPPFIQVGDNIPDLEVTLQNEKTVDLAKQYGSAILALFAYPKASTPGCTRQTSGFGDISGELKKLGATVFGISADSPKAQATFKEKTGVDFDLISDPSYELLGPLGAKKSPKGVIRSHWLFVNGKLVFEEHSVKPDDSPKIILDAVKEYASAKPDSEESPESKDESKDESKQEEKEPKAEEPKDNEATEEESKDNDETEDEESKENDDPNDEATEEESKEPNEEAKEEPKHEKPDSATDGKATDGKATDGKATDGKAESAAKAKADDERAKIEEEGANIRIEWP